MKSTKNKYFGIQKQDFVLLDTYDKMFREHSLIAKLMRERILQHQYVILEALDKDLAEAYRREFVRIEIDWERKQLIVIPTDDPQKKAEEADELIKNSKKN